MTTPPARSAPPLVTLPVRGPGYERADPALVARLEAVSAATAAATLHASGISRTWINGPAPLESGRHVVGSALTLQFMPKREDITDDGLGQESIERRTALWKVLEAVRPGDVLVVQAYGSAYTGCLGDMLVRYFQRRGGAGIVVDGRIRDSGRVRRLGVPIWCTGHTPNYASQCELFPWAYDVPVAVGGALCLPGDYVIADDDGAVVVPQQRAEDLADSAVDHEEWEAFSRMKIDEGGRLSDYYPLTPDTRKEFEGWLARQQ
jgi:regulator of RNase E activity RraA